MGQEIAHWLEEKNRCKRRKLSLLAPGTFFLDATREYGLVMPSRTFLLFAKRIDVLLSLILSASGPVHVSFGYQMSSVEIVSERLGALKLHSFIL